MKKTIKQAFVLTFVITSLQSHIIGMETKYDLTINPYKEDLLTALYDSGNGSSCLYIPEENLTNLDDLKKIFDDNGIRTVGWWSDEPWTTEGWNVAYKTFKNAHYDIINTVKIFYTLDALQKLLAKAKIITKSFLPVDGFPFVLTQDEYIEKHAIRRLFTYAKLQQVIAEKNLTHIRLPLKFLLIKDKETEQYVSTKEALQLLDSILKICVTPPTSFTIETISDRYTLDIFAKRETKEGNGFSKATIEELYILCKEAPFDIGYDNIFWDAKGDAVIIDTEHKGESEKDCVKLKRYPVNESLPTIENSTNEKVHNIIGSLWHKLSNWFAQKPTPQQEIARPKRILIDTTRE